jgi:hypothetical protein
MLMTVCNRDRSGRCRDRNGCRAERDLCGAASRERAEPRQEGTGSEGLAQPARE